MKLNRQKLVPALILAVVAVLAVCCRNSTGPSVLDVSTYSEGQNNCTRDTDARADDDQCRAIKRADWCRRFPSEPNCLDGGSSK